MTNSKAGTVVFSTRVSRLLASPVAADSGTPPPDVDFEALSALAEALECLSLVLQPATRGPVVDSRIANLKRRSVLLQEELRKRSGSLGSDSYSNSALCVSRLLPPLAETESSTAVPATDNVAARRD